MKKTHAIWITVLVCFGAVASALAQNRVAAEAAFREGRALMKAERYAEACEKLELSQRLEPAVGTLTNLGICNEMLGKLATAWIQLNEAGDLAARSGQSERAKQIRARASSLEPRLTRLKIAQVGDRPPGLKVTRDDLDVTILLGTAVPVDPGRYVIRATADGLEPWSQSVEATGAGATVSVEIPFLKPSNLAVERPQPTEERPTPAEKPSKPAEKRPRPVEQRPPEGQQNPPASIDKPAPPRPGEVEERAQPAAPSDYTRLSLIVGGAGAVALAVGVGFGIHAKVTYDKSDDFCDSNNLCSDQGIAHRDSAETSANVSNICFGVGVAAAATAGVLWLLSDDEAESLGAHGASVGPVAGADHIGFSLRGRF